MEILRQFERGRIKTALFDFDGTLSLIRQGWQEVMTSFMVDVLSSQANDESREALRDHVTKFITRLTGKQTIHQMIQLTDEIEARGGTPEDSLHYKSQYHARLWGRIERRIRDLESGRVAPAAWLVPGSIELLDNLKARGVRLYLASGTDDHFVKKETQLLGLDPFFDGRIYGALDDYKAFSKRMVIERILKSWDLNGPELVSFGDGYVEIENTRQVGGIAVGVASDEERRRGVDSWKRSRLIAAGADLIIPDFREQEDLVRYLMNEP